jgi:hypothetical protein
MTGTVAPFPGARAQPPSREELVKRVRRLLAADTANMRLEHPHVQQRITQRGVTMRQVLEVLRAGACVSGPTLDPYNDWRIKLRKVVAGRRVQVVVAVKESRFFVVTVI